MRMVFPGVRERRTIDRALTVFFRDHAENHFRRAVGALSRFYCLPRPRILWFEYLDWGKTAGRTYENGEIHLVHPENWKRVWIGTSIARDPSRHLAATSS